MRPVRHCSLLVAVWLSATPLGAAAQARVGGAVAVDSVAAWAIVDALQAQLTGAVERARRDTVATAWELDLPAEPAGIWREVRARILGSVRGRALLSTDSLRRWAAVFDVRIAGDSMSVQISLGSARKCGVEWMENDFWYLVRWRRAAAGRWSTPEVKPNYWSESLLGCP